MTEEKQEIVNAPLTRSPQYRSVYVNQVRTGMSTWDVQLTLGRITEVAPGVPAVEEQFTAVMAPEYVKAVIQVLTETVRQFEEKIGPITRSPQGGTESASLDAIKSGVQVKQEKMPAPGK